MKTPILRRFAPVLYLGAVSVTGALYLAGPLNAGPVFNAIGASAILAILVGASLNRPALRLPWHLFACAQALFVCGDVLAYNYERFFGTELLFPSVADPFYLGFYPALAAGLLLLLRWRSPGQDRASVIDSLIVFVAASALSWVYLMAPYAHDATLPLATKLTSMAYPLMDLLLLGVTVRLAVGGIEHGAAFRLLALGIFALLVTDAVYGWKQLHGGYETGGALDSGWIFFYAAFAAAALHPSMRHLSEPAPAPATGLSRRRLALLAGATLVAPAILAIRIQLDQPVDVPVLAGASAALSLLVVARIGGLMRDQEETVRRETILREAGEGLVRASTREEICRTGVSAAQALYHASSDISVYLIDDTRGSLVALAATDADASSPPALSTTGSGAPLSSRVVEGSTAAEATWEQLVDLYSETTKASLFPLLARGRLQGALVACADEVPPNAAAEALNVLASQLALALESVTVADESMRLRTEARLSSLVRNASDVLSIVAPDTTITYASPSAERVLGYRAETLTGARFLDFVHEDDTSALAAFVEAEAANPSPEPAGFEFRMRHREGRWLDVETVATSLLDDPSVGGIVLNTRDITDRRQAAELERRLQRSQRLESVGQLAGGIAHDFNNLLAVIFSYTSLVQEQIADGDPVCSQHIDEISKAGERAAALIRQLLVFSGRDVIEPQSLDVNDVLAGMKTLLERTIGEQIELQLTLAPDLLPVLSDRSQLEQVILNLAINARDAMTGGGKLTIETSNIRAPGRGAIAGGHGVSLRVADTGCGMSEDVAARAFEPFFSTKPKGKGSGLGLATVYGIVAAAGGELELDSRPGVGTVLELKLPSHRGALSRLAPPRAAPSKRSDDEATILLVDDEEAVLEVIRRILCRHGHEVLTAGSPSEALGKLATHQSPIDLLLTDVVMPEMSGRELGERVRRVQPEVAVLYMSGYDDEIVTRHGALEAGVPLLQKPFDTGALLAHVRETLDRGRGTGRSPARHSDHAPT